MKSGFFYVFSSPIVSTFFDTLVLISTDNTNLHHKRYVGNLRLVTSEYSEGNFCGGGFPILSPREVGASYVVPQGNATSAGVNVAKYGFSKQDVQVTRMGSGPRNGTAKLRGKSEAG